MRSKKLVTRICSYVAFVACLLAGMHAYARPGCHVANALNAPRLGLNSGKDNGRLGAMPTLPFGRNKYANPAGDQSQFVGTGFIRNVSYGTNEADQLLNGTDGEPLNVAVVTNKNELTNAIFIRQEGEISSNYKLRE